MRCAAREYGLAKRLLAIVSLSLGASMELGCAGPAQAQGLADPGLLTGPAGAGGIPLTPGLGINPMEAGAPLGTPAKRAGTREWSFSAQASATVTVTDNVNVAPSGQAQADTILGISMPLHLGRQGPRVNLVADYTPTAYLYADNRDANNVQNYLRSLLTLEAIDNRFFVEAGANVLPTYTSPFLPRPDTGVGTTSNRIQQIGLRLSPYIRRETGRGWKYVLRNDNLWTTYSDGALPNSTLNRLFATAESPPTRLHYGLDYTYVYTRDYSARTGYYQQVARLRPIWRATPAINLSARLGYEANDYGTEYSGGVYGAGIDWAPSPRTKLEGFLEHRFFGASYGLTFNHRSRRTAWKLSATRNLYTSALQPLTLRPGTTAEAVNEAFRSQIPDPAQREQAVRQFLDRAGLPPTLTEPYTFYTSQIYLAEQVGGSVTLLGRRNSVEFGLFWQENTPISTGGDLPSGVFATASRLRQQGGKLNLTHTLTPLTNVTLSANRLYATASGTPLAPSSRSVQDTVYLTLARRLGPDTNASVGLRWANFDSDISPYRELAALAAILHTF
jgi:uncharacterized protein (PEP-CTERM system associated)